MVRSRFATAVVAASLAAGCAATRSAAPVFGPVESTGMVVLVCRVEADLRDRSVTDDLTVGSFKFDQPEPIDAATLVNVADPTVPVRGLLLGNLIVFPSLAPGSYFIRSVLLERDFLERLDDADLCRDRTVYRFEPALAPDLVLNVAAGELSYVGRMTIHGEFVVASEAMRSTGLERKVILIQPLEDHKRYTIDRDESEEWMNWSRLLRTYAGTPWASRIETRIASLTPPAHP
jgi:hypothetical protein